VRRPVAQAGLPPLVRGLLAYPLPAGVGWSHVFGGLLLASFAIQVVTGALLALYYSPSASDAWESVAYVEREVRAGALIRGVHHFGSSSFIVLLVLHVIRTFVWGAYKGKRRWTWVVGCALLACVLGFGFTGYLLPWDLKAYFGTRVGVGIAGSAPVVGPYVERLLAGGPSVGALTLPRFYAAHAVILPLVTAGLVALHLTLLRVHGVTPHWRRGYAGDGRLFHPHQTAKDTALALLLVLVLLALAAWVGAPLGERADPQNTSYVPRPEWYFLGAQQLLRLFQGPFEILGSFVLPALGAAVLVLLPWIDRSPERDPWKRRRALSAGAAALASLVVLTVWGHFELRAEERALAARIAAAEAAGGEVAERDRSATTGAGTGDGGATPPGGEAAGPEPEDGGAAAELDEAALADRGARLYRDLACDACHGPDARLDAVPSLAFEGSVVQRDWLRGYLAAPTPIRYDWTGAPLAVRMPDFLLADDELDALVAHLATRTEERFDLAALEEPAAPKEVERGRALVEELDCRSCHVLGGAGEPVGPDLDGAGARLRPGYVAAIVLDPEGVVPMTSMTDFGLLEEEALAIARYLMTLR
jgi:ubiquinol-cytochrome c reductase cytochrome b subunit